jgi:hypothetical protein
VEFLSLDSMHTIAVAMQGLFANCKIKLFQNHVAVNPSTALGDLIEANFGGYAAVSCANAILQKDDGTGDWVVTPNVVPAFTADNSIASPQHVYGAYCTNTAGTLLIAFSQIDPAFLFANSGDGLIVGNLVFRLPIAVAQTGV